jgi:hypothetical protein
VKVRIQVIIENDDGLVQDVEEVACLKCGTLSPEELRLNLAEAKEILQSVQRSMTIHQVADPLQSESIARAVDNGECRRVTIRSNFVRCSAS